MAKTMQTDAVAPSMAIHPWTVRFDVRDAVLVKVELALKFPWTLQLAVGDDGRVSIDIKEA